MASISKPAVEVIDADHALYRKILIRLMPLLVLAYIIATLDRLNVGYAKLSMQADLSFSDTVYGFGAGIFFIGYFVFELPSNLILQRVGTRWWMARIMVTWGVVAACQALVHTPFQFYLARFLLGVAEAGFAPAVFLYLSSWFPASRRGVPMSILFLAWPVAGIFGGPVSGWILHLYANSGVLRPWQWLFIWEGIPAIVIAYFILTRMQETPQQASWLTPAEKTTIASALAIEASRKEDVGSLIKVFQNGFMWLLIAIYFCFLMGFVVLMFWLPALVKSSGVKDAFDVGLLCAIPSIAAMALVLVLGRSVDRSTDPRIHIAGSLALGAIGLALAVILKGPLLVVGALSIAYAGLFSGMTLFWLLPTATLGGFTAVAGIPIINSVGTLAGFISPYAVGWLNTSLHRTDYPILIMDGFVVASVLLVFFVPKARVERKREV